MIGSLRSRFGRSRIGRSRFRGYGLLALLLAGTAGSATAQDTSADARVRRLEAEVSALQRQVFPAAQGGRVYTPEIGAKAAPVGFTGAPATTAVTDLLGRMDALETQISRLTAQNEDNTNRLRLIEARLPAPASPVAVPGAPTLILPAAPAPVPSAVLTPAPSPTAPTVVTTTTTKVTTVPAKPLKPATTAGPSAERLAAVRAIARPATSDAGDDDYSYAYRLWEAKFYPEAEQQLKLFIDKNPRHPRLSYARNLLGRSFLDDAKPREAAPWFLQNYQADKTGPRAPDSLLYLAEAMSRLRDVSRACIALAEFKDNFPGEAGGRLKAQYDATRASVKCS